MSINSTERKAVGGTSFLSIYYDDFFFRQYVDNLTCIHTIVQISRINEKKINVALLNNNQLIH
jgi:hypothetical protein